MRGGSCLSIHAVGVSVHSGAGGGDAGGGMGQSSPAYGRPKSKHDCWQYLLSSHTALGLVPFGQYVLMPHSQALHVSPREAIQPDAVFEQGGTTEGGDGGGDGGGGEGGGGEGGGGEGGGGEGGGGDGGGGISSSMTFLAVSGRPTAASMRPPPPPRNLASSASLSSFSWPSSFLIGDVVCSFRWALAVVREAEGKRAAAADAALLAGALPGRSDRSRVYTAIP